MAEFEAEPDGSFLLIEDHCPICLCRVSDAGPPQCISALWGRRSKASREGTRGGDVAVVVYGDLTAGRLAPAPGSCSEEVTEKRMNAVAAKLRQPVSATADYTDDADAANE